MNRAPKNSEESLQLELAALGLCVKKVKNFNSFFLFSFHFFLAEKQFFFGVFLFDRALFRFVYCGLNIAFDFSPSSLLLTFFSFRFCRRKVHSTHNIMFDLLLFLNFNLYFFESFFLIRKGGTCKPCKSYRECESPHLRSNWKSLFEDVLGAKTTQPMKEFEMIKKSMNQSLHFCVHQLHKAAQFSFSFLSFIFQNQKVYCLFFLG